MNRLACVLAIAFVTWCVTGCKDGSSSTASTVKVSGTVNLDNKPMEGGEIRFSIPGQPPKTIEIKGGAFSGEAYVGKNLVQIVWEKEGPPNPMDPTSKIMVNSVAPQFAAPDSPLSAEIGKDGAKDLKFDVTSARR